MADIVITAANVTPQNGATIDKSRNFGATTNAGQCVYLDTTNNAWQLAAANAGNASARQANGISLNSGSSGQPAAILTAGSVNIGATVVQGKLYVLSGNTGGIANSADLTAGWYTNVIGTAISNSAIAVQLQFANVSV